MVFPEMLTIREAVEKTRLSEFSIRELIKQRKVQTIRLGRGTRGKHLINADSLARYLNGENDTD